MLVQLTCKQKKLDYYNCDLGTFSTIDIMIYNNIYWTLSCICIVDVLVPYIPFKITLGIFKTILNKFISINNYQEFCFIRFYIFVFHTHNSTFVISSTQRNDNI